MGKRSSQGPDLAVGLGLLVILSQNSTYYQSFFRRFYIDFMAVRALGYIDIQKTRE